MTYNLVTILCFIGTVQAMEFLVNVAAAQGRLGTVDMRH